MIAFGGERGGVVAIIEYLSFASGSASFFWRGADLSIS